MPETTLDTAVLSSLQVEARNVLLFSQREAARAGIVLPIADARAQHISQHLQCQEGDCVRVGVINGLKGTAMVKAVSGEAVRLAWNTWQDPPAPAPVAMVLAMPRPRVLRRLWRQIAELGISRIVLTITDTVPPGYSTSEAVRPHVVMREVLQGLEQAGDTLVPEIILEPSLSVALGVAEGPWGSIPETEGATEAPRKEWGPRKTLVPPPPILQRSQAIQTTRTVVHASTPSNPSPSASAGTVPEVETGSMAQKETDQVTATSASRADKVESSKRGSSQQRERLAFITQCLQVRSRQQAERWNTSNSSVGASDSNTMQLATSTTSAPPAILKVVCHPQDSSELLSDIVVRYSLQLREYGSYAWNCPKLSDRPQNTARGDEPTHSSVYLRGAIQAIQHTVASSCTSWHAGNSNGGSGAESGAGDYYYGSAEPSLQGSGHFDDSSFIGMCTEALNIVNCDAYNDTAAVAGAAAVLSAERLQAPSERTSKTSSNDTASSTGFQGASAASSVDSAYSSSSSTSAVGTSAVVGKEWGSGHVVVCLGPERGWSEKELALLERRGYLCARMGSRILSSPTAVVSAVAIVQEALR